MENRNEKLDHCGRRYRRASTHFLGFGRLSYHLRRHGRLRSSVMVNRETEQRLIREFEDGIRRELANQFERMKNEGPAVGLTQAEMEQFLMREGK
jgi:hypothetical protein